ncbi:unnamed protein product, partial [Cyprideis torosa]
MQYNLTHPLDATETRNAYDWHIVVRGGGFKGQAQAIRMAMSRALVEANQEYRVVLKPLKYLTRDA